MARLRSLLRTPRARLVAVLLVLVGGYVGAVAAAPFVADTVTVTAHLQERFCEYGLYDDLCWSPPHNKTVPRLVFARTFHDHVTIAAVRDAIEGIPRHAPGSFFFAANGFCDNLAEAGLYYYDFTFYRFGVLLQDVTVDSRCPIWHISTLGMPSVFDRFSDAAIVTIAHVTGMPTIPWL